MLPFQSGLAMTIGCASGMPSAPSFLRGTAQAEEASMGHVVMCIADTTRARFYIQQIRGAPFALVDELAHPEGGMRNSDLRTDRPGMTRTQYNRAVAAKNDPREVEHVKFAH